MPTFGSPEADILTWCGNERIIRIRESWTDALGQVEAEDGGDSSSLLPLIWLHLGETFAFSKDELRCYLLRMAKAFLGFANRQRGFAGLTAPDQRKLLLGNAPVFIQYLVAGYFTGRTAQHQIERLSLKPALAGAIDRMTLDVVTFESFNRALGLFDRRPENEPFYAAKLRLFATDAGFRRFDDDSLVALNVLFDDRNVPRLIERDKIRASLLEANSLIGDVAAFRRLTRRLTEMSDLFEASVDWNRGKNLRTALRQSVALPLETGSCEDQWLISQVDAFNCAFFSVSAGLETIRAVLEFRRSSELVDAAGFAKSSIYTYAERIRRVLTTQEPFVGLKDDTKARILRESCLYGVALTIARAEGRDGHRGA